MTQHYRRNAAAILIAGTGLILIAAPGLTADSVYWGDIHNHSSFSFDAYMSGNTSRPPADAIAYARDTEKLDFVAVTDHAEFYTRLQWRLAQNALNDANVDGQFVTLIGFEYTNTGNLNDLVPGYGHKCVLFRDTNVPNDVVAMSGVGNSSEAASAAELWQKLAGYAYITIPHHPAKGLSSHDPDTTMVMATDWDYVNAANQPVCEIYSVHGSSEAAGCEDPVLAFRADQSVEAALLRWTRPPHNPGYQMGLCGSTDTHKSTPGAVAELTNNVAPAEGPYTGGLIAVLAAAKTRAAIFDAITNKKTYATSGPRIGLWFSAAYGGQTVEMGQTVAYKGAFMPITLQVSARGDTAPIQKIQVIRNGTNIAEQAYTGVGSNDTVTMTFTDTEPFGWSYYRVKIYQQPTPHVWGMLQGSNAVFYSTNASEMAWSSPIWVRGLSAPTARDFDGDGKADPSVYKSTYALWSALLSGIGYAAVGAAEGQPGYMAVPADYDGDSLADPAVVDLASGRWMAMLSDSGYATVSANLGGPGYTPVPADYDGDGKADPAVFQAAAGMWWGLVSGSGYTPASLAFGDAACVAAPADLDGDRKADPVVFKASTGTWAARLSGSGYQTTTAGLGDAGSTPVPADYDGDGKADYAVFNAATGQWNWLQSGSSQVLKTVTLGGAGYSEPLPADYDGDGKTDPAVYNPTAGIWVVAPSAGSYTPIVIAL